MSLFVLANHMLLVYSALYLLGDFLRAFFYRSDTSSDAVGISVLFFFLSIWLAINSIVYYKAFLEEMDEYHAGRNHAIDGTGVSSANAEGGGPPLVETGAESSSASSDGLEQSPSRKSSLSMTAMRGPASHGTESFGSAWRRWTYYLNTEVGLAYFLNIVGSVGYVVSSLISLFLSSGSTYGARDIDKASLVLDCVNMFIFIIDGLLFWHVWWREANESSRQVQANDAVSSNAEAASSLSIGPLHNRCLSIYNFANLCNTASSIGYFCFIIWALNERFRLGREESRMIAAGAPADWYDESLIDVTFKQRTLYFIADLVYLIYAILLEYGWYSEVRTIGVRRNEAKAATSATADLNGIQLKEIVH